MEGIDPLADEIGVLGGQFSGIKASYDTDERHVTLKHALASAHNAGAVGT